MRVYITAINQAEQSRAFLQSVLLHLLVSLVLDSPPQALRKHLQRPPRPHYPVSVSSTCEHWLQLS